MAVVEEAADEQQEAGGGVTVAAEWGSFFWCDAEDAKEGGAACPEAPSCWAELLARTGAAVASSVEALLVDGPAVPLAPAYGGLDWFMAKTCFE